VLVGSLSNTFFALDQKTREPCWTFHAVSMVQSSPVVDGAVLFGSWDNNFYAVELASG
jgi:outer membrane protein assembly factor BamB